MENHELYIGVPNGVVVCIDCRISENIKGRLYHGYNKEEISFANMEQMIFIMDSFYNQLKYPFPGTNERSFLNKENIDGKERLIKVVEDRELLKNKGNLGTFIIRVQYRQNSTWQGTVTWVEENKTISFRSVLELLKLIDGALDGK